MQTSSSAQPFDREVLAELAVDEVVASELAFPVPIGVDLVDEHGPLLAAVAGEIALAVTLHVQLAAPARAGDGVLEDPGKDGLAPARARPSACRRSREMSVPTR